MSDTELLVKSEAPRRLEIFTGAGRRRSWTLEQKAQIIGECNEAGASVSAVARRHGLTSQQLFGWRRNARHLAEGADRGAMFAQVVVDAGTPISSTPPAPRIIEVEIGAATVRIPCGADSATVEAVLRAVKPVS